MGQCSGSGSYRYAIRLADDVIPCYDYNTEAERRKTLSTPRRVDKKVFAYVIRTYSIEEQTQRKFDAALSQSQLQTFFASPTRFACVCTLS